MNDADKSFATLRAKAALRGITVLRSDPADGPVRIFVCSRISTWREVRHIDDLETLLANLAPEVLQ